MSYVTRESEAKRDARWGALKSKKAALETGVQAWVNEATALHGDSPAGADKTDVIALRDELIANLRAILGV